MRIIGKLLAAIIFFVATFIAVSPLSAAFVNADGSSEGIGPFIGTGLGVLVALVVLFAPTVRRAFGRGFILSGCGFLSAPLTSSLLAGRVFNEVMAESTSTGSSQAAEVIGAGIGAGLATGIMSIIGLVVGIIFVIIGLVLALGGRREIIVVKE